MKMNFIGKIGSTVWSAQMNMLRSKSRAILTIIAIFVGSFTLSLTLGLNAGVNDYIDSQISGIGGKGTMLVQHKMDSMDLETDSGPAKYNPDAANSQSGSAGRMIPITSEDLDKIRAVDGIKDADTPHSVSAAYVEYDGGEKYEFSISGFISLLQNNYDLMSGEIVADSASDYEIVIGLDYLEPLGIVHLSGDADDTAEKHADEAVGKNVKIAAKNTITGKLKTFTAKITGVTTPSIMLADAMQNVANRALVDDMNDYIYEGVPSEMQPGTFGSYAQIDEPVTDERLDEITNKLEDMDFQAITVDDMIGIVKNVIDGITIVLIGFAAIALLAAAFGIINTLYMSVSERTREIGLMKAMGMSGIRVFTNFSMEAILIGFWGSVLAILASLGAGGIINSIAFDLFTKDMPGFTLIQFAPQNVLIVVVMIMLIAFLAGTLPAIKASQKNPIDALQYE
ncbi:MAG: ABC transporter permease [Bifidobacteriaceae bacterium]|jgi:putative ABC transport system permease protein|nr:ABC transporter permease [Bifidobacteriaceae bacterium]